MLLIKNNSSIPTSLFLPATRLLLAKAPFYAHLLANLPRQEADIHVPFALSWRKGLPLLLYNVALLRQLMKQEDWFCSWLQEELLHLLLRHPAQENEYEHQWAFHLAADMEVRQFMAADTGGWLYQKLLQRLHLPPSFSLQEAYGAIMSLRRSSGNDELLADWTSCPWSQSSHQYWNTFDQNTASQWGYWWKHQQIILNKYLSGGAEAELLNRLKTTSHSVHIPWEVLFRRIVLNGQRTHLKDSLRRPSRRFRTFPGTKRQRQLRICAIIDTSGSVSQLQREQFFGALEKLQALTSQIHIVEADAQVRKAYDFNGQSPPRSVGGGATNFDPALLYANTNGPFEAIVYLTDGEGPLPTIKMEAPLIWIINGERSSTVSPSWPGHIVYMDN